jgi:NADH-quinone oxidoreductase subunit A
MPVPSSDLEIFYLVFMTIVGVLFVLGAFFASRAIAPSHPNPTKNSPYECGEIAYGSAWTRFNVGYYIFALLFLVFEVEVVFLFPWAVVLKEFGLWALVEGAIFLVILIFGLVFAWRKGYLVWH